jgi:hypothetical protein
MSFIGALPLIMAGYEGGCRWRVQKGGVACVACIDAVALTVAVCF